MKTVRFTGIFLIGAAILFSGCNMAVNRSFTLRDGKTLRSGKIAINGSVNIGSDCKVGGTCRSINGVIRVDENSKVESLQSINGGITIKRDVVVHGSASTVNGSVTCGSNSIIHGNISAVNGCIELDQTEVERNIKVYNGDVILDRGSVVHGNIIVGRNKGKSHRTERILIEIRDGSEVKGDIRVEERDAEVEVILSGGGKVHGRVKGAEVIER